jgi:hypothetical protein
LSRSYCRDRRGNRDQRHAREKPTKISLAHFSLPYSGVRFVLFGLERLFQLIVFDTYVRLTLRCTAEQCDELAALHHSITSSAPARISPLARA